jgi:hypothetical protein
MNVSATFGAGALIGVSVVAAVTDPSSWDSPPTFTLFNTAIPLNVMWMTVTNAAWTVLAALGWDLMPAEWRWGRELLARIATGTALLSPVWLVALVFALHELASIRI